MKLTPPDHLCGEVVIPTEERWLHDLDTSIVESIAEMQAGGGIDLDVACDAVIAKL